MEGVQKRSDGADKRRELPHPAHHLGIAPNPPTRPAGHDAATRANVTRLRALLELFDIPQAALSRVTGLSKGYVSAVVNQRARPGIYPEKLFAALEPRLHELLCHRRRAFFLAETVPQEQIETALAELRRVA